MITSAQEALTAPGAPNATPVNNNQPIRPLLLLRQSETYMDALYGCLLLCKSTRRLAF